MYKLVFGKPKNYMVLTEGTLVHCAGRRELSGDLVLDPAGEVDQGEDWLFPWEKGDPNCYARGAQQKGWTH